MATAHKKQIPQSETGCYSVASFSRAIYLIQVKMMMYSVALFWINQHSFPRHLRVNSCVDCCCFCVHYILEFGKMCAFRPVECEFDFW